MVARPGRPQLLAGALVALALVACRTSDPGDPIGQARVLASPEESDYRTSPLTEGESGVALVCAKVLTVDRADRVFNPGMIVVRGGTIEYVGAPVELPEGYPTLEVAELWASPGMVDLHSHVQTGGWGDINDMVHPTNPELRVRPTLVPGNRLVRKACAGGVTTLFGIPGSGTSIGGFGVLYKTKTEAGYEEVVLRDPGGMKSAFNYNPQRGAGDLGTSWSGLSWLTEKINDRAVAAMQSGNDDPALADLVRVHRGELPVLIHCASAEGVAGTVRLWKGKYGTNCVVSHGSWDGPMAAQFAAEMGVPVNHGPRTMNYNIARREGKILGGAAEYMKAGVPDFSLNTDAGVIPQEELFLQGSMSARLGADSYQMLRAVTANPANSFLIGDQVGSLEAGKDADIVLSTGDPLDPRSRVELVLIDGEVQYSRRDDGQWF